MSRRHATPPATRGSRWPSATPDDPTRVYRVGGRVRDITAHGAVEQRRALARRYLDPVSADEPQGEQADALMLVVVPHRVARAA